VHRTRRGLSHAIADKIADPHLDVEYVSEVLGSMLEYTCYMWFTVGMDFDEQRVIDALTLVWTNATAPKPTTSVQGRKAAHRRPAETHPVRVGNSAKSPGAATIVQPPRAKTQGGESAKA
jgi:hypothetical protein